MQENARKPFYQYKLDKPDIYTVVVKNELMSLQFTS